MFSKGPEAEDSASYGLETLEKLRGICSQNGFRFRSGDLTSFVVEAVNSDAKLGIVGDKRDLKRRTKQ
jgi:hypothetical protein